ncbi:MAG TPA: Crp/Fnr family transcriptional regulator [Bacteroidia bacterium]|nr:Crp/Fnr family transcriptional regulator [Bacteroidia bacterium]
MNFETILTSISKHISLTSKEKKQFTDALVEKKIKKRQFLLHDGEICKNSAFVTNGCLRSYSIDKNGFEHILQFAPEGWWIADMYSLISQLPGHLNIDALEDTNILLLARKDQEKLFEDIPRLERFFRIITEKSLVASQQRLLDNMSLTAQQRYANFCTNYPTLIKSVAQKQIASYIGVTPEFLSKLRSDFFKKK